MGRQGVGILHSIACSLLALGLCTVPASAASKQGKADPRQLRVEAATESEILVSLGAVRRGSGPAPASLQREVLTLTRQSLSNLPFVRLVPSRAESAKRPMVLLTTNVSRLSVERRGNQVVYKASVECTVHRLPDQAIAGTLRGRASVSATAGEIKNAARASAIKNAVLKAAVANAIKDSSAALRAAARH